MRQFIRDYFAHLVFIFLLCFVVIKTYSVYSIGWDEVDYVTYGKHYTIKILDTFSIPHKIVDDKDIYLEGWIFEKHKKGHGVIFDIANFSIASFLPGGPTFENIHLTRALSAIPIFLFLAFIVTQVTDKKTGFFSLFILLLFPRFYGDIFVNAIDVPMATVFAATIAWYVYFFNKKPNVFATFGLSILSSILISHRFALGYIVPLFIFFTCLFEYKKRNEFIAACLHSGLYIVLTILFLHVLHPHLWEKPLIGIFDLIFTSQKYQFDAAVLHAGNFLSASKLPANYVIHSMLITIPESTLFLFCMGHIYIFSLFKAKKTPRAKKYLALLFIILFYAFILLTFVMRPVLYDMWRHVLFLTVPIITISSYGAYALLTSLPKKLGLGILVVVFVGYMFTATTMIKLHPYQYVYFNSLVGGLPGAYGKYETDYWGIGYREAVLWFDNNINDKKSTYNIIVEGDPLSTQYYFAKNMKLVTDSTQADYFIASTRWNLHERYGGKTIYTVEREGVPLIFIKKLK